MQEGKKTYCLIRVVCLFCGADGSLSSATSTYIALAIFPSLNEDRLYEKKHKLIFNLRCTVPVSLDRFLFLADLRPAYPSFKSR
jgi:hypothetical protein